jgi:hypothetical protein
LKNLKTSLPQIEVHWSAREIRSMASSAYRDLADERRAAGDIAGARELERLAEQPEATLDAARKAWEAQFGDVASAQGKTVETSDIEAPDHREEPYVMESRAREGVRVHALAAELEEPEAEYGGLEMDW